MKKIFDAVKFQRDRRAELSRKFEGMKPKEIVEYLRKYSVQPTKTQKETRHRV